MQFMCYRYHKGFIMDKRKFNEVTDQEFKESWKKYHSLTSALNELQVSTSSYTMKSAKKRAHQLGLKDDHFAPKGSLYNDEQLEKAWRESQNIRQVLMNLGLVANGANYSTLRKRAHQINLSEKDFINEKEKSYNGQVIRVTLYDIITNKVPYSSSQRLIKKLIDAGIMTRRCSECGITHYHGQPINLELDHINGNHHDNSLSNLRVLCPNCHSMTKTYGYRK